MSLTKEECLRARYDQAFQQWAAQVNRLHVENELAAAGAPGGEAQERVDAAESVYRQSRDLLAREIAGAARENQPR